ncbi:MAG: ATP-binding protein [Chloroflexi bacterium]|nr:ATP-binding protein [Chloroflexota bacterium]
MESLAAGRHAVPQEVRQRVKDSFFDFIGNKPAVDTLKRAVLKALLTAPPQLPASYLFTGNPSSGKTELARRVAHCLRLPFVSIDGRALSSRERLFDLVDGALHDVGQQARDAGTQYQKQVLEYPPVVIFVDEIHLAPRAIQESLLTVLELKTRSLLLAERVARLPSATFLFATSRPSKVDMAFRTRCTEIPLQDYVEDEVATIVGLEYSGWPEPLRRRIARYGSLVPRIALELAKELATEALVSEHPERTLEEHLEEVRTTRLIGENSLKRPHMEYLELLERERKGRR